MTTVEKRNETLKEEIETKLHVSIHRLSVHRTMTIQSGAHACTEMQLCPSIVKSIPSINCYRFANPAEATGGFEDSRLGGPSMLKRKGTREGNNETKREKMNSEKQERTKEGKEELGKGAKEEMRKG